MQPSETFRVLLFLFLIVLVYAAAAGVLVRVMLRRRRAVTSPVSGREVWYRCIVFALAAAGVGCGAYGYWIEPYRPEVTRVRLESNKVPGGSPAIRIVHLSDIHSESRPRLEEQLPEIVKAERPDLIVFTGDAINSRDGLPLFKRCMSRLAAIAPVLAVRGNWDIDFWSGVDLFSETGARELDGEAVQLEINGIRLWIAGAPVNKEGGVGSLLHSLPTDALTLFLFHYPDLIAEVARHKIDLYCAGHTHGGQVAIPGYGALVTLSRLGKRYEAGLYRESDTWLYVNRGIGMAGGAGPRVRFCARPEITVIELASSL